MVRAGPLAVTWVAACPCSGSASVAASRAGCGPLNADSRTIQGVTYFRVSPAGWAAWTAIGTLTLAGATVVAIVVASIQARRGRRRADAERLAEIKRDNDKRAEDRARDDRLRRKAAGERDRRDAAERRAREDYEARQVVVGLARCMPSAYKVPMASDVLPDPDTPTTATVRHSGTSTSMSRRLLCLAPRTLMAAGSVPGADRSGIVMATTQAGLRDLARDRRSPVPGASGRAGSAVRGSQGWTGPLGPLSRRSDCMMANVVVSVNASTSAAARTPVYLAMTGAAARSVTVSRWAFTPAQKFSP